MNYEGEIKISEISGQMSSLQFVSLGHMGCCVVVYLQKHEEYRLIRLTLHSDVDSESN